MSNFEFIQRNHSQRSLAAMSANSPSARALNLHALWKAAPGEGDYRTQPFFSHPILNRSIVLKHNVRPGEEGMANHRRLGATKVILPFDPMDLNLGGQYLILGQENFTTHLTRSLDYKDLALERDLKLLDLLDRLPSLDPFLLSQLSRHYQLDIAPCYFRISQADMENMSKFVSNEIAVLLRLCLGSDPKTEAMAGVDTRKLISLLIDNEADEASMSILREGLRIDRGDFSQSIFAWKALLYYKWRLAELAPALRRTVAAISGIVTERRASHSMQINCDRFRTNIMSTISEAWSEANSVIAEYDKVYRAMTEDGRPSLFRQFLFTASDQFISLGDRIGRLDHACGFWRARFPNGVKRMEAEELCAFLLEFDHSLATELSLPPLSSLGERMELQRTGAEPAPSSSGLV